MSWMTSISDWWTSMAEYQIYFIILICFCVWAIYKIIGYLREDKKSDIEVKHPNTNKVSFDDKLNEIVSNNSGVGTVKYHSEELTFIEDQLKAKVLEYERIKNDIVIYEQKLFNLKVQIKRLVQDKQATEAQLINLKGDSFGRR